MLTLLIAGATIGAAQLDNLFEKVLVERLSAADIAVPTGLEDLHQTAWEMRVSKEYQYAYSTCQ